MNGDIIKVNVKRSAGAGKPKRSGRLLTIVLSVLLVVTLAAAGYFAWQYYQLRSNPDKLQQDETTSLVQKVGKLYQLPSGTPTIATINDKDKLKSQPFFAQAENGDKLLIYNDAKLAIIYRESENRIINVGPVALSSTQNSDQSAAH